MNHVRGETKIEGGKAKADARCRLVTSHAILTGGAATLPPNLTDGGRTPTWLTTKAFQLKNESAVSGYGDLRSQNRRTLPGKEVRMHEDKRVVPSQEIVLSVTSKIG
jgi:hypothetical protein